MGCLVHDITAFAERDKGLTRGQKDAKDVKPFWSKQVVRFHDETWKPPLFKCPNGNDLSMFTDVYSGHKTDASTLETKRFNPLRLKLDKAYSRFAASGGGDGGPVDPESMYVMSSNFWNFCNGDLELYYLYVVLAKFNALQCTVSAMSPAHSFGSDVQHRDISGTRPRKSIEGDLGGPLVIHRSDDEVAAKKSKRKILESQAMTAADDAMATLISKYSEAKAAVEAHEEAPGFVSGDFIHGVKKARVVIIEEALNKLMSAGSN
jgi:hypothetical protein